MDLISTIPILLFSIEIARQSSFGEQSRDKILIPLVAPGYHFLMKS
jgi:hypothetical protein